MRIIAFLLTLFLLQGCGLVAYREQIRLLQDISRDQAQIDAALKQQEKRFNHLASDVKKNRLRKGLRQEAIIAAYGAAVFCETIPSAGPGSAVSLCIYRPGPVKIFSDLVYLYFDEKLTLVSAVFSPAEPPSK